jgi:hypothetical protein
MNKKTEGRKTLKMVGEKDLNNSLPICNKNCSQKDRRELSS